MGRVGRLFLRSMNVEHGVVTRKGLAMVSFAPGMTMLDIGCGGGATLRRLLKRSPGGIVHGLDHSPDSVAFARQYNSDTLGKQSFVEQGDVASMPYEDSTFDLATAIETVYFWEDIDAAMDEVHRVLKPQGQFLICCEVGVADGNVWTRIIDEMHTYSPEQLTAILERHGFEIVTTHTNWVGYLLILSRAVKLTENDNNFTNPIEKE